MSRLLKAIPRVLSIAIAGFFFMMSFDETVFSVGFLMHNIPTAIIITIIAIWWKNSLKSSIAFLVLGLTTIFFFNTYRHMQAVLIVTMPFAVVSLLHLLNYYFLERKRSL
ncbi:hypothetical protein GF369_04680 [Candidatus Peregrinibacteria bacterium]|nr:hypothetical protein [Candidatus Peregrinibacteria bacterium]